MYTLTTHPKISLKNKQKTTCDKIVNRWTWRMWSLYNLFVWMALLFFFFGGGGGGDNIHHQKCLWWKTDSFRKQSTFPFIQWYRSICFRIVVYVHNLNYFVLNNLGNLIIIPTAKHATKQQQNQQINKSHTHTHTHTHIKKATKNYIYIKIKIKH